HRLHVLGVARQHRRVGRIIAGATLVALVGSEVARDLQSEFREIFLQAHPNTSTALPVMAKGAPVQRNVTTFATSSHFICGEYGVFFSMAVSTDAGSTAAQKMCRSRPSSASDLISPVSPHLLAL